MAQPFILKLGTTDFSDFLRVGEDNTPVSDFEDPAFSDAPLGEGQPLISLDAKNNEQSWALFLNDDTKDLLHDLIAQANVACEAKGTLEWRDAGATKSTYWDVTYARFVPAYNYRRGVHGWLAGVLRVYNAPPYGHTGTDRIVATVLGAALTTATTLGVAGDADGLPQYDYFTAGNPGPGGRNTIIAQVPAGYEVFIPPASLAKNARATVTADALAPASQALMMATSSVTAAVHDLARLALSGAVYGGRQRIFAAFKPARYGGALLSLAGPDGQPVGPTANADANLGYQLVDLGVYSVPSSVPTTLLRLGAAAKRRALDDGPLQLNVNGDRVVGALGGIYVVPEEKAVAVVERLAEPVAGRWLTSAILPPASGFFFPTMVATTIVGAEGIADDFGNVLQPLASYQWSLNASGLCPASVGQSNNSFGLPQSSRWVTDVRARMLFKPATYGVIQFYGKVSPGGGVWGEFQPDASLPLLLIRSFDQFNGSLAGVLSVQPTSLYSNGPSTLLEMTVVSRGSAAYANLRLTGATGIGIFSGGLGIGPTTVPIASVGLSDAMIAGIAGRGYITVGTTLSGPLWAIQYVGWEQLSGVAGASERLLVDGVSRDITKTTPASSVGATQLQPLAHRLIGRLPLLTASQQRIALITAAADGGPMNTPASLIIRARERWRYAR